jgi:hypothetical protein
MHVDTLALFSHYMVMRTGIGERIVLRRDREKRESFFGTKTPISLLSAHLDRGSFDPLRCKLFWCSKTVMYVRPEATTSQR